jgi:hypothetical protein
MGKNASLTTKAYLRKLIISNSYITSRAFLLLLMGQNLINDEEITAAGTQHICNRFSEHIDITVGFHNLIEVVHTQVHP